MLNEREDDLQRDRLLREFSSQFFEGSYRAVCTRGQTEDIEGVLTLQNLEGLTVCLGETETLARAGWTEPSGCSSLFSGLAGLNRAYEEAYFAWKQAFFSGETLVPYAPVEDADCHVTAQQLQGLIQVGRWKEVIGWFSRLFALAGEKQINPDTVAKLC